MVAQWHLMPLGMHNSAYLGLFLLLYMCLLTTETVFQSLQSHSKIVQLGFPVGTI